MTPPRFDALILGAGPAGASAALALARAGRTPLLLDALPFPREKVCGGGVNPLAIAALGLDLSDVLGPRVTRVRFTWAGQEPVEAELPPEAALHMVYRGPFDARLVAAAEVAGAVFRPACPASHLRRTDTGWMADTPEGPIEAPFVVVADGGKGRLARSLGLDIPRRLFPAMEAEPRWPLARTDTAHMDFGFAQGGYAWAFPKAEGWNIGAGSAPRRRVDLRAASRDMGQLVGCDAPLQLLGHPICLWDGPATYHAEGLLVAGEAAALVDPFTAEGIRFAILSGLKAGEAIHAALGGAQEALPAYTAELMDWGIDFAWARRLAAVFYRFPRVAYRVGVQRPHAPERLARLFSGELRYRDLAARALRVLASGVMLRRG